MHNWLRTRWHRLGQALQGLGSAWSGEVHVKLHVVAMLGWVVVGWWVAWDGVAWAILCLGFALVGGAELINTALEGMVDAWCLDPSPMAKHIKDVAAGAVLWVVVMVTLVAFLLLYRQVIA